MTAATDARLGRDATRQGVNVIIPRGLVAAILTSVLVAPAWGRPVSEVLRDATRCFATYDAAFKAAELNLNPAAKARVEPRRAGWISLLQVIGRLASAGKSPEEVAEIAQWQATFYREQFDRVVRSMADGEESVFVEMHVFCQALSKEISKAAASTP